MKTVHVFNWDKEKKYPLAYAIEAWKEYLSYFPKNTPCLLEFMPDDKLESLTSECKSLFEILKRG
jgi:hypothetical protein